MRVTRAEISRAKRNALLYMYLFNDLGQRTLPITGDICLNNKSAMWLILKFSVLVSCAGRLWGGTVCKNYWIVKSVEGGDRDSTELVWVNIVFNKVPTWREGGSGQTICFYEIYIWGYQLISLLLHDVIRGPAWPSHPTNVRVQSSASSQQWPHLGLWSYQLWRH